MSDIILSIIIPVLDSHEILRRQILHWERINIPKDVEILIMDDGSDPPLEFTTSLNNFGIYPTYDKREWTWAIARNAGARLASGKYYLMIDIDFIIPRDTIDFCRKFTGDRIQFKREFGILNERGEFTQDVTVLKSYGLLQERIDKSGLRIRSHRNMFVLRKEIFWDIGGYREDLIGRRYPQGEDSSFKRSWERYVKNKGGVVCDYGPMVYMFPNGKFCGDVDYNPFDLFHNLSRK